MKHISILGATGSIGLQTLDVIRKEKEHFKLKGISVNTSYSKTVEIIEEFKPDTIAVTDRSNYEEIKKYCSINNISSRVIYGLDGLNEVATLSDIDMVVTSIVGMVGLIPTLNAINAGKNIALANKETLVVGGELVKLAADRKGVKILPVDSEHGAIFQCLQGNAMSEVNKIILTASGGPFRGKKTEDLLDVTSEDALKHPKWNMGRKISIDSATLMNKGLEVIEAHWLFGIDYGNIEVVVHPQSIIHSMVEYIDGSVIAQMGNADMRLPIQYAMNYPKRKQRIIPSLDFYSLGGLTFEKPDLQTFKCLSFAYEAGKAGGTMPTILNAANEIAVELFLSERISFLDITNIIEECMNRYTPMKISSVEDIINTDTLIRDYVHKKYVK